MWSRMAVGIWEHSAAAATQKFAKANDNCTWGFSKCSCTRKRHLTETPSQKITVKPSMPRHSTAVDRRTWSWEERHDQSMASVNQTRPHCVNQMGKTHSKPLAARHGRGTAWAQHAMCESTLNVYITTLRISTRSNPQGITIRGTSMK